LQQLRPSNVSRGLISSKSLTYAYEKSNLEDIEFSEQRPV